MKLEIQHDHAHPHTHGSACGIAPPSTWRPLGIDTVVPYLLRKGVLAARDIVDERFEVVDLTRRNRNFRVVRSDGTGVIVKQPKTRGDLGLAASFRNEATFLQRVSQDDVLAPLARSIPRLVYYDPEELVLAIELIHPATSLTKLHLNGGNIEFAEDGAISAAHVLAGFHTRAGRAHKEGALPLPPRTYPIALTLPSYLAHRARQQDAAAAAYLQLLAGTPLAEGGEALAAAARDWESNPEVAHGDARWDNYLLTHGPGVGGDLNLRLIDWELVAEGDPAYDVASFLGDYLRFRTVIAMTRLSRGAIDPAAGPIFPLSDCVASARAFWEAYARRRRLGQAREAFLDRVARYLPSYLALVAWELTSRWSATGGGGVLSPASVALVEVAKVSATGPRAWLASELGVSA